MDNFVETPLWEMAAIRSELMNFFAGQKIKISLMLREGRQLDDGRFVLFPPNETVELPYGAVVPGTVRYIGSLGEVARVETFPVEEQFHSNESEAYRERAMSRGTTLGQNMYSGKGRAAVTPTPAAESEVSGSSGVNMELAGGGGGGRSEKKEGGKEVEKPTGNELKLLEMLLKRPAPPKEATFSLNLFEDDAFGSLGKEKKGDEAATKEAVARPKSTGVKPRSATTRLSKKLKDSMKLEPAEGENAPDAGNEEKKKPTRGEQMLEMMDTEVAKEKEKPSRPKSRGKSPAGAAPKGVPMRNTVTRAGGRTSAASNK